MQGWHPGLPLPSPWLSWAWTRPCSVHGDVETAWAVATALHCACAGGRTAAREPEVCQECFFSTLLRVAGVCQMGRLRGHRCLSGR